MFYCINIYSFIPVNGCVGMSSSALLCPGAHNAVKMALGKDGCYICITVYLYL
jgi:hypothetical protein